MNCSYFAMERRRTFKLNKNNKRIKQKNKNKYKYKKQNKKTTNKQTNQNKTKQNQNIQTSERRIHYTRSITLTLLDSKIQHLIPGDKFTPLSATKEQLSYQH